MNVEQLPSGVEISESRDCTRCEVATFPGPRRQREEANRRSMVANASEQPLTVHGLHQAGCCRPKSQVNLGEGCKLPFDRAGASRVLPSRSHAGSFMVTQLRRAFGLRCQDVDFFDDDHVSDFFTIGKPWRFEG